jgi:hypothetical protein
MSEQMLCGHQHPGRADAALCAAALKEGLLQGMQFGVDREAFYGIDMCALCLKDWNHATIDKFPVHADGARSAFALAAAFFRSGELKVFAKNIEQALHGGSFD